MKRFGIFLSGIASIAGALTVFLAVTGQSFLVGERLYAPGFGFEYPPYTHGMPVPGLHLQCTYFTGRSLRRTAVELEPCNTYAPACPFTTCPVWGDLRKAS